MKLANPRNTLDYLRKKSKESLAAGILVFVTAIILAFFTLTIIAEISANSTNVSEVLGWVGYFDIYTQDFIVVIFSLMPTVALFAVGYLVLESHPLSWKILFVISIATTILAITGSLQLTMAIPIITLTAIAGSISIRSKKT